MCLSSCSYYNQYSQTVSQLWSTPSYSQRINHTSSSQKCTLDMDQLSLTISNLSPISKIIERVVKSRLNDFLTINPHQSAYCKHRCTEAAHLYIDDQLINATGSQKISCLCPFDLSVAFGSVVHSILINVKKTSVL